IKVDINGAGECVFAFRKIRRVIIMDVCFCVVDQMVVVFILTQEVVFLSAKCPFLSICGCLFPDLM
ncbi:hypothetical protein NNO02_20840, partial [Citrobacter sp. Awk 2]|uniref:hypothetical protein n=1 Tax=Citrobacter sp. Awk 2 TaxID=2963959 RepID=UPI002302A648